MRKQFDKVKKLHKSISLDLHRDMLAVKDNTVLIIVYIWGILKSPFAVVNSDGDDPVVFPGRMIQPSGIPFIFHTELAFWIAALFCILCCCDSLWIFLRFRKVDGNIYGSIRTFYRPSPVFLYTVAADIVRILAEFVKKFSGSLRALFIFFPEPLLNLGRSWNQTIHDLGIQQVSISNTIFNDPSFYSLI